MTGKTVTSTASFNNYTKSIAPSEARLSAVGRDGTVKPVEVLETTVRGTISNFNNVYGKAAGEITKSLDPENANIQRIDTCSLPGDAEILRVSFTVAYRAETKAPNGCNSVAAYHALCKLTEEYRNKGGFDYLAQRYAWRLVDASWLWRNRYSVDKIVTVTLLSPGAATGPDTPPLKTWKFKADDIPTDRFDEEKIGRAVVSGRFSDLSAVIAGALSGATPPVFFEVVAEGFLAPGQEVFPSQEFVGDGSGPKQKKGAKGRTLASVNNGGVRQGVIHSQKIGNALRRVDEWHADVDEYGAIAAETYGYVQSRSTAIRLPKGKNRSFYDLLLKLDDLKTSIETAATVNNIPGDVHYFVSVLVRGGVFSIKEGNGE